MKYKIRQKVVYIGPDYRDHPIVRMAGLSVPVGKVIYTIRGGRILPAPFNYPAYLLEEIVNELRPCPRCGETLEMHISEDALRALIERKNDGEAFVARLRPLLVGRSRRLRALIGDET